MRPLDRLQPHDRARHAEMPALELHRVRAPHRLEHPDELVGPGRARLRIRPDGFQLVGRPRLPQADARPSAGKEIEGGESPGEDHGVVEGHVEDARPERDPPRVGGREGQRLHRVQAALEVLRQGPVGGGRIRRARRERIQEAVARPTGSDSRAPRRAGRCGVSASGPPSGPRVGSTQPNRIRRPPCARTRVRQDAVPVVALAIGAARAASP